MGRQRRWLIVAAVVAIAFSFFVKTRQPDAPGSKPIEPSTPIFITEADQVLSNNSPPVSTDNIPADPVIAASQPIVRPTDKWTQRYVATEVAKELLRQEKESKVAQESVEETVQNLMYAESFFEAPLESRNWMRDPRGASEAIRTDVRFQKLISDNYSEGDGRQRVVDAILSSSDKYLSELPLLQKSESDPFGASVMSSPGVSAASMILAEIDPSLNSLRHIVDLHSHRQSASQNFVALAGKGHESEYIYSLDGALFAEAENIILDNMLNELDSGVEFDVGITEALEEYRSAKSDELFDAGDPNDGMVCHKQEIVYGIAQQIAMNLKQ